MLLDNKLIPKNSLNKIVDSFIFMARATRARRASIKIKICLNSPK